VLVVDLPTCAYVEALVQHPLYAKYTELSTTRELCVVNLSPAAVVMHPRFTEVFSAFHKSTKVCFRVAVLLYIGVCCVVCPFVLLRGLRFYILFPICSCF
jgi:hypothetical protein